MSPYEIELSKDVSSAINAMVDLSREHKVITLFCVVQEMASGNVIFRTSAGDAYVVMDMIEDPIFALTAYELVKAKATGDQSTTVLITRAGYEWVDYHRKWRIGRISYRLFDTGKTSALVLISLTAFILSVLQVLQAIGIL